MGTAVNIAAYQEPVPVHRRIDVEPVLDGDLNFITPAQAEDRSRNLSRITVDTRWLAAHERVLSECCLQFDGASSFGSVDQRRDRQAPVEALRPTLRKATTQETSEQAARHDRGGAERKLAAVQRRLQNEAPFNFTRR